MKTLDEWKIVFEDYLSNNPTSDGSHDISHFKRVWELANRLSSTKEDHLVILASCYFHDIVNYPKNDPRRSQSSKDAAIKAAEILNDLQFPFDKIDSVKHCIEAHSYSANIPTKTKEAEIVQDADRMEALGAIGLARTFYVSGLMKRKLFCPDDPFAENRELDDNKFALDHFYIKLLGLPMTMKTEKGRIEAQKRAAVLERFILDLKEELGIVCSTGK